MSVKVKEKTCRVVEEVAVGPMTALELSSIDDWFDRFEVTVRLIDDRGTVLVALSGRRYDDSPDLYSALSDMLIGDILGETGSEFELVLRRIE